ncbi:MAG: YbhB/YbcL family Raf kinase inhibitor-like protein [Anaerolineaceae bacterium]
MRLSKFIATTLAVIGILLSSACISYSGTGLIISSPNITDGGVMPSEFTCNGKDISPEIDWSGAPVNSKSYALVMVDPDAPGGTFTHWLVYDMPKSMILLPKRMTDLAKIIGGTKQGTNDFGKIGYSGPCPPAGETHSYIITIYALDANLDLDPAVNIIRLLDVMEPRILEQASMTVIYSPPAQ